MLVRNLLLSHDKERFEVAACSLYPKKGTIIENDLGNNNIEVFYLEKKLGPDPKMLPSIYNVFKKFNPHIIHTHRYVVRYTLLPSHILRIPVKIHTVHNIADKEVDLPGKIIHKIAFKLLQTTPVALSSETKKTIEKLYGIHNIPVIYNGIHIFDYQNSSAKRQKTKALLNIQDDQFVILHIGRFSPQKNHKLLIEAFSKVLLHSSDVLLLLVGDGELKTEIESHVNSRGIQNNVRFLGMRKDIPELLSASDLFVLSSDWEGVPLVILEAMAAGKPVVATSVGGVPEVVADGKSGFLVTKGDAYALADAILKILKTPDFAVRMGDNGRIIARDRFDIKETAKSYEKLYLECLKRNGKIP